MEKKNFDSLFNEALREVLNDGGKKKAMKLRFNLLEEEINEFDAFDGDEHDFLSKVNLEKAAFMQIKSALGSSLPVTKKTISDFLSRETNDTKKKKK